MGITPYKVRGIRFLVKEWAMKTDRLEESYKNQLIGAGVNLYEAEQAARLLTWEELRLIGEIWPEWAVTFCQAEAIT